MKYKKENLLKLLELVKEVSSQPDNEWFKEKLHKEFSINVSSESFTFNSIDAKVNLIREYLSIDLNSIIDYSEFEEPTRESLFRDCLEMGRYEKGTPSHKIDFGEFCRYAHLQAEEMINYFLNKKSNLDIDLIDQFIQYKVPSYKPQRKPTEVHHIFYTHKLSAFKSISDLSRKSLDTLWFLNDYRNELSHRNSLSNSLEDKDLVLYEQAGFVSSQINFSNLSQKEKEIYNHGKYVIAKRRKDFTNIYETLEDLKKRVIETLLSLKELPNTKSTNGSLSPTLPTIKLKLNQDKK